MKTNPAADDLLTRVGQHDMDAFAELYDRHAPKLLGILMQMLGNRAAAEDIVDEVFQRVWSQARFLSRDGSSLAFSLVLMARAKAVGRLRTVKNLPHHECLDGLRKVPAWLPKAKEIEHLDQRQELLKKVFGQLPQPQRDALELAVFEGLTEPEIAARLGEPSARVRAGMLAAMTFLRHRVAAVMGTWTANI